MRIPKRQAILCCAFVLTIGLGVAPVKSQAGTPGMPVIAQFAYNVKTLQGILRGRTPATIDEYITFRDPTGEISTYQPDGAATTADNGFFSPDITENGRTCFTCHQPQNGWALSPPEIMAQFRHTRGQAPLFQPIDAADCPNSSGATANFSDPDFQTSRSHLFNRGNFRISLNCPNPLGPQSPDLSYTTFDGNTDPDWVLTVEYDPFGCELDFEGGDLSANLCSVYRRPLPSANVAFLLRYHSGINPLKGGDIMWDGREQDLETQFVNATLFHGQTLTVPDPAVVMQGANFQSGMFTAQVYDNWAQDLTFGDPTEGEISGPLGGPVNLYDWRQEVSGTPCDFEAAPFGSLKCDGIKEKHGVAPNRFNVGTQLYDFFENSTIPNKHRRAQQESIARGESLFDGTDPAGVFLINKVAGLNDVKSDANGQEFGTCSTCHSNKNVLNDTAGDPKRLGIMDNSNNVKEDSGNNEVIVMPWTPDFPRFAFYCQTDSIPFFSNPVDDWANCPGHVTPCDKFITTDPGMGLITGKCNDLGKMKVPILRGLASRAPYFHGGNAPTLLDLVNFYNNRFHINLTDQEKQDLVNYLNSL
jgi:cytochrome c peroxidase